MAKYIILDTETDGLNTHTCNMLSVGAFILTSDDKGKVLNIQHKERYFATSEEVPADAAVVNHLSKKIVNELAKGEFIEDCYDDIKCIFDAPEATVLGWNLPFDTAVIRQNLSRNGLPAPKWDRELDVMQLARPLLAHTGYAKKSRVKLIKAVDEILHIQHHLTDEQIENAFKKITKKEVIGYHDASYDAYVTTLIFCYILPRLEG